MPARSSGYFGGPGTQHCGLPISTVVGGRKYQPNSIYCYERAKDRVTTAAVVAGVSILGAGAAVWLLAPQR